MRTTKIILVVGFVLIAGTAFAVEPNKSGYGFQLGAKQNEARSAVFAKAKTFTNDADREAFFEQNKIGIGSAYADQQHLNVEALVEAKVIDQNTANAIKVYASKKHDTISGNFANANFENMTPSQTHDFYEKMNEQNLSGDTVDDLLANGLITKTQATAINKFISK